MFSWDGFGFVDEFDNIVEPPFVEVLELVVHDGTEFLVFGDGLGNFFGALEGGSEHIFFDFVKGLSDGENIFELAFGELFFLDDELLVFWGVDIAAKIYLSFGS